MKTAAIICEYNPFHNGHKYHIMETKKKYITPNCLEVDVVLEDITCASGDFDVKDNNDLLDDGYVEL